MRKEKTLAGMLLIALLLEAAPVAAAPAMPGAITRTQPNGEQLAVTLHGDERRHFMTTADGYLVQENPQGRICYVIYRKGKAKISCLQARNADMRPKCHARWVQKHGVCMDANASGGSPAPNE